MSTPDLEQGNRQHPALAFERSSDAPILGEVPRSPLGPHHSSDSELLPRLQDEKREHEIVVTWDGPDDPSNPLNWSWKRKWVATIIVSCFTFISPFSSTMVTPALGEIGHEFNIPEGFMRQLVMSIFLLGYAQGPFVLAPLSEIFGRVSVLQIANLAYLAFNTAGGFSKTKGQMLAFRFLAGIGGSAPQALCNGVLADTWRKEERGKGQAVYGMLTFIGPAVAPIVGAYVSTYANWRWIFWSTSCFDVLVQLLALFFLSETYHPKILTNKAKEVRKECPGKSVRTEHDDPTKTFGKILRKRLVLPFIMLFTHPAVQAPSIYRAFLYGVMYLVLSTFSTVFEDIYSMPRTTASLNYISLGIGFIIGLQITHPVLDRLYAYLKARNKTEEGLPEYRIPPILIGAILTPFGLLLYGWSAQFRTHWIVPNIGTVIFATGLIIAFQCVQGYIVDAYDAKHAASAAAVGAFLRTMCGFAFPLFAPSMYAGLGVGVGNSVLAGAMLVLAVVGPGVLWFWGKKLRALSTTGLDT